jgi:hypothetical protein
MTHTLIIRSFREILSKILCYLKKKNSVLFEKKKNSVIFEKKILSISVESIHSLAVIIAII